MLDFTFEELENTFRLADNKNYNILTCKDYYDLKKEDMLPEKYLVNRVDIDYDCIKASLVSNIFYRLGIKATFFIRVHGEYNPFSHYNYKALQSIINKGHEIGLHCEAFSFSDITHIDPINIILRDKELLETLFRVSIYGCSSHGDGIGRNNLDLWDSITPKDVGLLYHAYENSSNFDLFYNSFYVSDSNFTYWKTYLNGVSQLENTKSLYDYIQEDYLKMYTLIHPISYTM
jgi:hypothetical protein